MKKTFLIITAIVFTQFFVACGGSSSGSKEDSKKEASAPDDIHHKVADFVELDLNSSGVPAKMMAPKGTKITTMKDGSVILQAGKYYQMTLSINQTSLSEDYIDMVRELAKDKDMNSSFDKFIADETNGVLKANKDGELNFIWAAPAENGCLIATNGVQYDKAIDGYTKQQPDDIKIMWESAKTLVIQ